MSKQSKLLCIDLGFWEDKILYKDTVKKYKSVVGVGKKLQLGDLNVFNNQKENKDHIICKLPGESYFVSDLAIDECETVFYSLESNRFNSQITKVLINTAYSVALGGGHHETYLVSGLPLDHYNKFRKDIINLFKADGETVQPYEVEIDGITIMGSVIGIDSRFIPQPFGVLLDLILDDKGNIEDNQRCAKTIAIIDIGFGTTDVYVANSLSPIEKLSFSTPIAMNHAYTLISNKIKEKCEIDVPLYKIHSVVKTGRFLKFGKLYNMSPIVDWAMKSTALQLISELSTKWKNTHEIDEICLAGGGGIRLQDYILPQFENIFLSTNGQEAVVRGYQKWGKRTWKDVV